MSSSVGFAVCPAGGIPMWGRGLAVLLESSGRIMTKGSIPRWRQHEKRPRSSRRPAKRCPLDWCVERPKGQGVSGRLE